MYCCEESLFKRVAVWEGCRADWLGQNRSDFKPTFSRTEFRFQFEGKSTHAGPRAIRGLSHLFLCPSVKSIGARRG